MKINTSLIFIRFVEHKTVLKCIKFTFIKKQENIIKEEIKEDLIKLFESQNISPNRLD